jgi:dual specificity phosphatase 12
VSHFWTLLSFIPFFIQGDSIDREGKVVSCNIFTDRTLVPMETDNSQVKAEQNPSILYRCKKCRRIVASQESEVSHSPGEGETRFKGKRRSTRDLSQTERKVDCSSIFVEPMQWMEAVQEGAVEGKLTCAGCKARLGYFNWAGLQCSCGTWVNPAFRLSKSRMDACTF